MDMRVTDIGDAPTRPLPRVVALVRRDVYHFDALIALGEILIDLAREGDALNAFERVLRFDPNHLEALRYYRLLKRGRS